ncbi:MAG: hypothetical protein WCO05_00755 [Candidatus Moraniibacteriota bacterium]
MLFSILVDIAIEKINLENGTVYNFIIRDGKIIKIAGNGIIDPALQ